MAEKIQILYISYDGMTDNLGQSQVIPYLLGLSSHGYKFSILSCEKSDKLLKKKVLISNILDAAGIAWFPIAYTKSPPVFSTLYDYYQLKRNAEKILQKKNYTIVHCRSYIPALIGISLKKKYGIKFIFDMRGFWADERIDGGLWRLDNPIYKMVYRFFKRKEKEFLEQADAIVSLTERAKTEMLSWKHINKPLEITVIPCCVDTTLFDITKVSKEEQHILRQELSLDSNNFVLGYLGSIGTWYMLDEMLDFFVELKIKHNEAKFVFVTHDEHKRILDTAFTKKIDKNDIIIRPAERSEVPLILSIFTYSIFFIKPTYSKISSSPTKQGEIMAMGVPVVCNAGVGDTDEIVKKYKSGFVVKNFHYKNTIELIDTQVFDPSEIHDGAVVYFSLKNGIGKYAELYKSFTN